MVEVKSRFASVFHVETTRAAAPLCGSKILYIEVSAQYNPTVLNSLRILSCAALNMARP